MLTFFGGGRGCVGALTRPSTRHLLPKNFEKAALRKRWGIFTVKMRGGHIYGNYCILQKPTPPTVVTNTNTTDKDKDKDIDEDVQGVPKK